MKSIKMLMAAIMVCGTMSAQAQDYYNTKHDFAIAIGGPSTSQILNTMSDFTSIAAEAATTSLITVGSYTGYTSYKDNSSIPTISAEYVYHITKLIGIGGMLGFNSESQDIYADWKNNTDGSVENKKMGDATRTNLTIMPIAKFDWLRKKHVGLYSKVGIGLTMMIDKQKKDNGDKLLNETRWSANFQASLIGFEFGSQAFRGFTELGFGEQGVAVLGLRYKM